MKDLVPYKPLGQLTEQDALDLTCMILDRIQSEITELKNNQNELLTSFGFDPSKPATIAKWKELSEKVEDGVITEKDRLREMQGYLWIEADKERNRAIAQKRNSSKK